MVCIRRLAIWVFKYNILILGTLELRPALFYREQESTMTRAWLRSIRHVRVVSLHLDQIWAIVRIICALDETACAMGSVVAHFLNGVSSNTVFGFPDRLVQAEWTKVLKLHVV